MKQWYLYVQDEHDPQPRPATDEERRMVQASGWDFQHEHLFRPSPHVLDLLKGLRDAN